MKKANIEIRIEEKEKNLLSAALKRKNITISAFLRLCIKNYLKEEGYIDNE